MGKFWFNGRCCTDFGIIASGEGAYNAPARDVEYITVPGRHGSLLQDNERFRNITVTYPVAILRDFARKAAHARAWLMSAQGYCRLRDDYHPDSYRLAVFEGPVDFDMKFLNRIGEANLSFTCKPQRYLAAGNRALQFVEAGVLHNPTAFAAQPQIMVVGNGSGSLTIGSTVVEISEVGGTMMLDCESMDAYATVDGAIVSRNAQIYAPEFPELSPGKNNISFDGGVTAVEIVPRWWTL